MKSTSPEQSICCDQSSDTQFDTLISQYHMNGFSQNIYFYSFTFETITYFFSCYKGLLLVKLLIKLEL